MPCEYTFNIIRPKIAAERRCPFQFAMCCALLRGLVLLMPLARTQRDRYRRITEEGASFSNIQRRPKDVGVPQVLRTLNINGNSKAGGQMRVIIPGQCSQLKQIGSGLLWHSLKRRTAKCRAVRAQVVRRQGLVVRVYPRTAGVAPLAAAVACNHALPVIVARAAAARHQPLLRTTCMHVGLMLSRFATNYTPTDLSRLHIRVRGSASETHKRSAAGPAHRHGAIQG